MTTKQRLSILLDRWPRACRAQGWDPGDRELRLEVIGQAVGRRVFSMNDLDNAKDIDAVYAHLGRLADNVALTVETLPARTFTIFVGPRRRPKVVQDTPGLRRRLLWLIRRDAKPLGDDRYFAKLPQCRKLCAGVSTLEDLPTERLHQLMETLHARRGAKAARAAEPEPEMAAAAAGGENNPF